MQGYAKETVGYRLYLKPQMRAMKQNQGNIAFFISRNRNQCPRSIMEFSKTRSVTALGQLATITNVAGGLKPTFMSIPLNPNPKAKSIDSRQPILLLRKIKTVPDAQFVLLTTIGLSESDITLTRTLRESDH